jgi:hypothetical protein
MVSRKVQEVVGTIEWPAAREGQVLYGGLGPVVIVTENTRSLPPAHLSARRVAIR